MDSIATPTGLRKFDVSRVRDSVERYRKHPGQWDGLRTGYKHLDRTLRGLKRKRLITIAARPSIGKTTLALNIAANIACAGGRVAFFSQEMDEDQLLMRLASILSGVPSDAIESGYYYVGGKEYAVPEEHYARFQVGLDACAQLNIRLYEESLSVDAMRQYLRPFRSNVDLVIDDHIGLHSDGGNMMTSPYQSVTRNVKALKQMALSMNLPIIVLSQLNRAVEQRESKIPVMSDLRDSGEVEQSSDVVILLYRKGYYLTPEEGHDLITDKMELHITKNKDGKVGVIYLPIVLSTGMIANEESDLVVEERDILENSLMETEELIADAVG